MSTKTHDLATVHPPLNEPITYGERGADCPVCGAAITHTPSKEHSGTWEDHVSCDQCGAGMHMECFWGRVATIEEWQTYRRGIVGGPKDYQHTTALCAQCRAKGENA